MTRPPFVDPDYWRLLGGQTPAPKPPETDIYAIRKTVNAATKAASDALPFPAGMTTTVSTATSADGTNFAITRFVPLAVQKQQQQQQQDQGAAPRSRAIVYVSGGGLIAGGVSASHNMIAALAERTATQVFAPDYRLAPEHAHPAALDDVCACLAWLRGRAGELGVDPARIVTFGQSAGGALTAAAAFRERDAGGPDSPIAAQVLRYPMLDDRTGMDEGDPRFPFLTWSPSSNALAWGAYLGRVDGREGGSVPYTAAPARAEDLHGLPPTHLGVGGLDLFRDESTSFAGRLSSHGVRVESRVYPGVPHGFDGSPAFSLRFDLWSNEAKFIQQF